MVEALRKAGIKNWLIFWDGRDLFHLIKCENYQHAMEQFLADPVGDRWQREMAILFDSTHEALTFVKSLFGTLEFDIEAA